MDRSLKIRLGFCIALTFAAIYLLIPTLWSLENPDLDHPPSWMPQSSMKLGLDLKGGVQLTMSVDLDKAIRDQLQNYTVGILDEGSKEGVTGLKTEFRKDQFEMDLFLNKAEESAVLAKIVEKKFPGAVEITGTSKNIVGLRIPHSQEAYFRDNAIRQCIETIRNRIDEFGVSEPIISRKGEDQILVQFPGAKEPDRLKALIGQTAQLNFQIVHECRDPNCLAQQQADLQIKIKDAETAGHYTRESFKRLSEYRDRINNDLKAKLPENTTVAFEKERDLNVVGGLRLKPFLLSTLHKISGDNIKEAFVSMESASQLHLGSERPVVNFRMNTAGTPLLAKLTEEFRGYYMAIVLDGIVRSAPVIQSSIPNGSGMIQLGQGGPDEITREANDTAIVLRAGALPASIEISEERVIGPSIGREAIVSGKTSLIVASLLIFAFMWVYYGMGGLIANILTLINIALIFAILGSMGATLTLPGIAGIVLTISLAVDSMIIIYERMRDEIRLGKGPKQILEFGYDRAFTTILDSNVTTAVGAFVLLQYGTGSIRGFALTLLVGICVNVFIATYFSKTIFLWLSGGKKIINVGIPIQTPSHTSHKAKA